MPLDLSSDAIGETAVQQFCVEMMKRLDIQRRNEHFCDVILKVGSGDEQACLKAHRIVLCAASPFFYNALNSDMKEKKEGVIRLEETSKAVMEEVLEYLYTGHVDINEKNAYDLMAVADYLVLPSLKALSGKVILQTLSLSSCIMAYYSAIKYRCEELQNGSKEFIQTNFVAVAETEDFLNLSSKQVEEWISSDEIVVKGEENIFEVVVKWVEDNGGKKFQFFYDLFRHVRLIYVLRNYLFKVILPHRFVRDRKKCVDLVVNVMSSSSDGTEECFFSQSPRNCLKTYEDVIVSCGEKRLLCYVPSENRWYELARLLSAHNHFSHALSACHNKLYIIGGSKNGSVAECYEPSLNLWAPTKDPEIVVESSSVVILQGFLYVIGGRDKNKERTDTVQKYNPDTNLWETVAPLSSPRSRVCAVADGNYLYAVGGLDTIGHSLRTVERFDPTNNTWDELPATLAGRASAGGAAIKQKVFIFGGLPGNSSTANSCEMYDPTTSLWTGIQSVVAPRMYASAVSFKGQIFVFGGFQNEQGGQETSLQVYDVEQDQWKPCSNALFGTELFKISRLRVLKDVLARCRIVDT